MPPTDPRDDAPASDSPDGTSASDSPDGTSASDSPDGTSASDSLDGTRASNLPDGTSASNLPDGTSASDSPNDGSERRSATGTSTAPPSTLLLALVALQTVAVGLLAGVAASLTDSFVPLDTLPAAGASGTAAVAASRTLHVLFLVVLALYVVGPVAVAGYGLARGERHWLAPVAWAAVAVLGVPWLGYVLVSLATPLPDGPALVALVAGPALVAVASRVAAARGPDGVAPGPRAVAFGNVAVVLVFAAGMAAGAGVLAGPLSGTVEETTLTAPTAAWDFDYRPTGDGRGVLTVSHDGGDVVDADHLLVRGSGFADVPGANQTAPGRWRGSTGSADGRTGSGSVAYGGAVAVGVTSDCRIRLVYEDGPVVQTIGSHECPVGEGDDARVRPPRLGGGR